MRSPFEQRLPRLGFKLRDRPVHRGLRQPEAARGEGEVLGVGHGNQRGELCTRCCHHQPRRQLLQRAVETAKGAAHPLPQDPPAFGREDTLPGPVEQRPARLALELAQRLRHRGLRNVNTFRGESQRSEVADGKKHPEMTKVARDHDGRTAASQISGRAIRLPYCRITPIRRSNPHPGLRSSQLCQPREE